MSQEERDWLEWLKRVQDGVVTQRRAAAKMGVSDRWVRKLLRRMEADGDAVVVHGLRGRSSNRQIDEQTQARAIVLLKEPEWYDFGPTFASEQLAKRHDIRVSKETVRGWMVAAGLWKAQSRKLGEAHFWRPRRSGYGELVQWDTSTHDWLEGRGDVRYLVRWIDDATSRSGGRFVLCCTTGRGRTWACYGSTWKATGEWWICTPTGRGSSWWRRGPRKAPSSARKRIA